MARYYFDMREGDDLVANEEGMEIPDLKAAEVEAASSLLAMAKDCDPSVDCHRLAIEVRTDRGPLFQVAFLFEMTRHKQ